MLNVVTVDKALGMLWENFTEFRLSEEVRISDASGRILSVDIISEENIPAFDRSTVDGYALISEDTFGAGENMPSMLTVKGEILMGEEVSTEISRGECMKISTGGMLPKGADSVIMCEYTDEGFDGTCLCLKGVAPLENVTKKGDDVKTGDRVLKKGTKLSSASLGVLSALGVTKIPYVKRPVIGIISTGDEIIDCWEKPSYGQVRDINSVLLASLLREKGCDTKEYGIIRDEREKIESALLKALSECDAVLISGGSSKGARDMTADIISEYGELLFHGLAMKPGKPTIGGKCGNKAVFGLPGHPAAAYFVALRLVIPFIDILTGEERDVECRRYPLGTDISSNHGREEVVPVKITDGKIYPVFGKSGLVTLVSRSDGYIIIDRNREGVFLGEETEVYFIK